jgi:hypothetical protein
MSDARRNAGMEEVYRYEPPRVFEPGQVPQQGFEECCEERPRREGESIKDWLDAVHRAMLEAPMGLEPKAPRRRQIGLIRMPVLDEGNLFTYEEEFSPQSA